MNVYDFEQRGGAMAEIFHRVHPMKGGNSLSKLVFFLICSGQLFYKWGTDSFAAATV